MKSNIERFPAIVKAPKEVRIYNSDYIVYKFIFNGLSELYNYLKSNPEINYSHFDNTLSSITGDYNFAGKPYDDAVEQLVNYKDPKYKEFLTFSTKTKAKNLKKGATFVPVDGVAGGIILPYKLATGDINMYRSTKIIKNDNTICIYAIANYLGNTSKKQVKYKAIILTNVIHALEKQGYRVNVNAFSASECNGEIIDIDLNIKTNNSGVNYQALYRSFCDVEFLRRIIFRVRETSDVKNDWSGYGCTIDEDFAKEYLHIKKNILYFGTPREMGIRGLDIANDFESAVCHLNLEDKIDVDRAKVLIKRSMNQ